MKAGYAAAAAKGALRSWRLPPELDAKKPRSAGLSWWSGLESSKRRGGPVWKPGLPHPQKRAGARLRSRSSSGQADMIAVVFILENSCDVPTTRSLPAWLTAFRKKMQPKFVASAALEFVKNDSEKFNTHRMKRLETWVGIYRVLHFTRRQPPKFLQALMKLPASVLPVARSRHGPPSGGARTRRSRPVAGPG